MYNGKLEEFICYCIESIVSYGVKQANNKEMTLCSNTNLQMKNEKRMKERRIKKNKKKTAFACS